MVTSKQEIYAHGRYSHWFLLVASIFITCLITSNIIAVKLVNILGLILPAGSIIFPVSYIFGDVLTEVYGYRQARQVIWLGFFCNLIAVVAILLGASFLAYLVGEFANSFVLAKMKIVTKGRWLWTRTIGSTLVGQGLDSLVFITLAFIGIIPLTVLAGAIVVQWLFKSVYEAIATPLTYLVVNFLKKKEGLDVFDTHTQFNPLRFRG